MQTGDWRLSNVGAFPSATSTWKQGQPTSHQASSGIFSSSALRAQEALAEREAALAARFSMDEHDFDNMLTQMSATVLGAQADVASDISEREADHGVHPLAQNALKVEEACLAAARSEYASARSEFRVARAELSQKESELSNCEAALAKRSEEATASDQALQKRIGDLERALRADQLQGLKDMQNRITSHKQALLAEQEEKRQLVVKLASAQDKLVDNNKDYSEQRNAVLTQEVKEMHAELLEERKRNEKLSSLLASLSANAPEDITANSDIESSVSASLMVADNDNGEDVQEEPSSPPSVADMEIRAPPVSLAAARRSSAPSIPMSRGNLEERARRSIGGRPSVVPRRSLPINRVPGAVNS